MYFTVLFVVHNGSYVLEYTVVHSVQAADTSLLFECTMLHSKPRAQTDNVTNYSVSPAMLYYLLRFRILPRCSRGKNNISIS